MFLQSLTLQLGYNATLVTLGAALLGLAAGVTGTFLFLRKRALVSDAISHATLPGVGIAFLLMVWLGGDGRNLAGLLIGAFVSAGVGLLAVQWLSARTRLAEDAAIGAVLSVFYGFGIVILTVIQTISAGRQAGLESFLLGSTAGMLRSEALLIAGGGAAALALVALLHRPMLMVSFDPGYAATRGVSPNRIDLLTMALVLAVTVTGLKVVGLILIVALLIIPAAAARLWSNRAGYVAAIAGAMGGAAGWIGAAASATAPDLPTGPLIVLAAFALFTLSFLVAPRRGVLAAAYTQRQFQHRVHVRQGLLALAQGHRLHEPLTRRLLRREGLIRRDDVATDLGRAEAAKALNDEARWRALAQLPGFEAAAARYDGLSRIEAVLTPDQIEDLDRRIQRGTEPPR